MTKKKTALDIIDIPKLCSVPWEEMAGSDNVRYCDLCRKHVHNLSAMRRSEAESLLIASRGQLCARFVRLGDGTIETLPDLPLPSPKALRASHAAAAIAAAMLGLSGAQAWSRPAAPPAAASQPIEAGATEAKEVATGWDMAMLGGAVTGVEGDPVAGALVTLTSQDSGGILFTATGADGRYLFESVPEGSYNMLVAADGYRRSEFSGVELVAGQSHQTDITLYRVPVRVLVGSVTIVTLPSPLRSLYEQSALVVVGTPGKSARVSRDGNTTLIKTRVKISEAIKGKTSRGSIDVYHEGKAEGEDPFADGSLLLLFLKPRADQGGSRTRGYEQVDSGGRTSTKIDHWKLGSYVSHLKYLQAILRQRVPSRADLAEWLVQLAEDPATRSEAAIDPVWKSPPWESYDQILQATSKAAAASVPQPLGKRAEPVDTNATDPAQPACALSPSGDDDGLDDLLTPGQKDRVMNLIVPTDDISSDDDGLNDLLTPGQKDRVMNVILGMDDISADDMQLIRAVDQWGDGRLAPFLLSKLEQMESDPQPIAGPLMEEVAEKILDDPDLRIAASDAADLFDDDSDDEQSDGGGTDGNVNAGTNGDASSPDRSIEDPTDKQGDGSLAPGAGTGSKAEAAKLELSQAIKHFVSAARTKLDTQTAPESSEKQ